jgi:hypothetical protein
MRVHPRGQPLVDFSQPLGHAVEGAQQAGHLRRQAVHAAVHPVAAVPAVEDAAGQGVAAGAGLEAQPGAFPGPLQDLLPRLGADHEPWPHEVEVVVFRLVEAGVIRT